MESGRSRKPEKSPGIRKPNCPGPTAGLTPRTHTQTRTHIRTQRTKNKMSPGLAHLLPPLSAFAPLFLRAALS
eukprot:scaffold6489_cov105-Pinguiococcus_pyrenoidosus.AAC.1